MFLRSLQAGTWGRKSISTFLIKIVMMYHEGRLFFQKKDQTCCSRELLRHLTWHDFKASFRDSGDSSFIWAVLHYFIFLPTGFCVSYDILILCIEDLIHATLSLIYLFINLKCADLCDRNLCTRDTKAINFYPFGLSFTFTLIFVFCCITYITDINLLLSFTGRSKENKRGRTAWKCEPLLPFLRF